MRYNKATRRQILEAGIGAAALVASPALLTSRASASFKLDNLHNQICKRVRVLNAKNKRPLTILYPTGSLANLQPVAQTFQREAETQVRFQEASLDNINSQILLANLTGDSNFDVALPATFGIPDLAQAGAIRSLDDFAQQYEPEGFQTGSLYSIGDYYKGKLYGYQTDGDAYIMFYNQRMLDDPEERKRLEDKTGNRVTLPRTWGEVSQLMKHFHRPDDNMFGGNLFRTPGYVPWEWWIRFHSKGFYPFNDEMQPQINNEAGVEALNDLIADTAYLSLTAKTDGLFENWASYSKGNSLCNIGWGGSQKHFNGKDSNIRGQLAYGQTPGGMVNGKLLRTPYFNWGWNYIVSSKSQSPELAYLFTLYACSPVISTEAVRQNGYFDPFREEHYQDEQIVSVYSNEFLNAHQQSMKHAIPDLYLNGQGDYFSVLRENLAAAASNELTAKEALDRTARSWNLITFRLGKKSQIEQWKFLKSRYPEGIRDRLV